MQTTGTSSTTPDSASIGSALVTALGGGTGVDMTALATSLATAQFAGRLGTLDNKSNRLDSQISAASTLKSNLLTLASSLGDRVRSGDLAARPNVANTAVASASLPLGSGGVTDSYSLEVTALAAPQVLKSTAFTSASSPIGSGTLTLNFGSIAGGVFTADSGHAAATITIASGATLSDAADAINAAGAGVTAYIANGADGARLVFKGAKGAANAFTLTANETPGDPGLAALVWEPVSGDPARQVGAAGDAQYKLDGVVRTSASNSIENAAPGLSLKLTGTNIGAPTQITFSDPAANVTTAMQDITSALNTLVTELNSEVNPLTGTLSADTGARALSRKLAALPTTEIMPSAASGAPKSLSDLGLSVQKDGQFSFDGAVLTKALQSNPSAVTAMFTNGLYGVYASFDSISRGATAPSDPGSLAGSIKRYGALKATLSTQRSTLATQQDKLRSQMVNRFAKTNTAVAAAKSTLTYLQNQVAVWSNKGN